MQDLERLEEQLYNQSMFWGTRRRHNALDELMFGDPSVPVVAILARAVVRSEDQHVRDMALATLETWPRMIVLEGVTPIQRELQHPDLEELLSYRTNRPDEVGQSPAQPVETPLALSRNPADVPKKAGHPVVDSFQTTQLLADSQVAQAHELMLETYESLSADWVHSELPSDAWRKHLEMLVKNEAWEALWQLCRLVTPLQTLTILQALQKTSFEPKQNATLYQQLCALANRCHNLQRPDRWVVQKLLLHNNQSYYDRMQFSADGRYLICAHSREVLVWTIPDGYFVGSIDMPNFGRTNLAVHPHENRLWAHSDTSSIIYHYSLEPKFTYHDEIENEHIIKSLALSHDGKTLFVGDEEGSVSVWDTTQLQRIARHASPTKGEVYLLQTSGDGRWLASATDREVAVWQLPEMKQVASIRIKKEDEVEAVHFPPDGETIVVSPDGIDAILICRLPSGKQRWCTASEGHQGTGVTPDGKALLVTHSSDELHWLDLSDGEKLMELAFSTEVIVFHPHKFLWATYEAYDNPWIKLWGESALYKLLYKPLSMWDINEVDVMEDAMLRPTMQTREMLHSDRLQWIDYCRTLSWLARQDEIDVVDFEQGVSDAFDIEIADE